MKNTSAYLIDQKKIESLITAGERIPLNRKKSLQSIAHQVNKTISDTGLANLLFVCTHNSRRSQLAELWCRVAADYYRVEGLSAYSAGTEATSFNIRMVDALRRFGFVIEPQSEGMNAIQQLFTHDGRKSGPVMFSKRYDHESIPSGHLMAIMVCSDAERDCPFIPGAQYRVALPFEDPKASDDTPMEEMIYDKKVEEIGCELLYLVSLIANA